MARGLFLDFSIDEVQAIQKKAKEFFLQGKTLMEWTIGESHSRNQFTLAPDLILEECAYALRILDPDNEAYQERPRITRTRANFGGC